MVLTRLLKKKSHLVLRGTHREPKGSKVLFHKGYQKDQCSSTEALVKGFFRIPLTKYIFGRPLIKGFAKLSSSYKSLPWLTISRHHAARGNLARKYPLDPGQRVLVRERSRERERWMQLTFCMEVPLPWPM